VVSINLLHRYTHFVACTVKSWDCIYNYLSIYSFNMWYEWYCYLTMYVHLSDEVSTWSRSLHAAAARGWKTRAASISQHLHLEWFVYQLTFYIILHNLAWFFHVSGHYCFPFPKFVWCRLHLPTLTRWANFNVLKAVCGAESATRILLLHAVALFYTCNML
jgi:hypothetical protein